MSGALPGSVLSLDRLDLRSPCNLRPDCSDALRVRAFGEREVEGLVRAADGLYAGAVLREGVGFWIWPRTSAERLTLSPLANPGDRRYGLYITGCFE